jgi:hypothetical protein
MGLLKKAVMGTAYAKIGIFGEAGSGKTRTAYEQAKWLSTLTKKKAIAFFDTEKGSDFMQPLAEKDGIDFYVHKSKSYGELLQYIKEIEKEGVEILIIDSITHVWVELQTAYLKSKNKSRLSLPDWGILKGQWKMFTDAFLNSKIHIIMCGRAGTTYDTVENEDTQKQEMIKSGTKMKAEGETGYEPDFLIEMERVDTKVGIINRAWVVKDRSDTLNGKSFDMPTAKSFKPFYDFIKIGGEHKGIGDATSADLFSKPDWSYEDRKKRKEIAIEAIQEALTLGDLEGRSADATKKRTETLVRHFGGSGKTQIESLTVDQLESGLHNLKIELGLVKPENEPPKLDTTEELN